MLQFLVRPLLAVIFTGLLFCGPVNLLHAEQSLREAMLSGNVALGGKAMSYRLKVVYEPDASGGYPGGSTSIGSIVLTLGNRDIVLPRKAYRYFHDASSPEPPFTSYPDDTHGRFYISGGDGEKSYRIGFVFDKYHLLTRELYRHMETKPEIARFDQEHR